MSAHVLPSDDATDCAWALHLAERAEAHGNSRLGALWRAYATLITIASKSP